MLPRYNEINYKKSIKKRLVRLKLNGSLDSYEELNNEPEFRNLSIKELKKLGKNIKQIVINKFEITEKEFNDFKDENPNIQYVKSRWNDERKKGFGTIENFYNWYINQQKFCCYCGIPESLLQEYFYNPNLSKRKRGKKLEIERILTDKDNNSYSIENCSLACYVCNNSKSDLINYKDFKHIALGIHNFWKLKYHDSNFIFPESFYTKEFNVSK